jgi:integrase
MPKSSRAGGKAKALLYPREDALLLGCRDVALERRIAYGVLAREGMRAGELEALKFRDVDLEHGRVRLDENKTNDPRAWALSPDVVRTLVWWKSLRKAEDSDLVIGVDLSQGAHWLKGRPKDSKSRHTVERKGDLELCWRHAPRALRAVEVSPADPTP